MAALSYKRGALSRFQPYIAALCTLYRRQQLLLTHATTNLGFCPLYKVDTLQCEFRYIEAESNGSFESYDTQIVQLDP